MFIYDFNFDCGRQGSLSGLFVVDQRGKDLLTALIASRRGVYFGEVLGKHSEVYGPIDPGDVTERAIAPEDVARCAATMGWTIDPDGFPWCTISGFNPLETLAERADVYEWNPERFAAAVAGEVTR